MLLRCFSIDHSCLLTPVQFLPDEIFSTPGLELEHLDNNLVLHCSNTRIKIINLTFLLVLTTLGIKLTVVIFIPRPTWDILSMFLVKPCLCHLHQIIQLLLLRHILFQPLHQLLNIHILLQDTSLNLIQFNPTIQ